jgi:hypothetical protein
LFLGVLLLLLLLRLQLLLGCSGTQRFSNKLQLLLLYYLVSYAVFCLPPLLLLLLQWHGCQLGEPGQQMVCLAVVCMLWPDVASAAAAAAAAAAALQ